MTQNQKILVPVASIALTLVASLAGCLVGKADARLSFQEGLDTISRQLGLIGPGDALLQVSGLERFDPTHSGLTGKVTDWTYTYYNHLQDQVRMISVDSSGVTSNQAYPSYGNFLNVAPAMASVPVDSSQVANLVAQATTATPPSGTDITYSLNSLSGSPVWYVQVQQPSVNGQWGARSILLFDGSSGSSLPAAGSLVNGIPFKAARTVADAAMLVEQPDAFLFDVHGIEFDVGADPPWLFRLDRMHMGMVTTPDLVPGDGMSGYWGFQYYSGSTNQVIPVLVYANLAPVLGHSQDARGGPKYYADDKLGNITDPYDLVQRIPVTNRSNSVYRFWTTSDGEHLKFLWAIQGIGGYEMGWSFDAYTGALDGCSRNGPCV